MGSAPNRPGKHRQSPLEASGDGRQVLAYWISSVHPVGQRPATGHRHGRHFRPVEKGVQPLGATEAAPSRGSE